MRDDGYRALNSCPKQISRRKALRVVGWLSEGFICENGDRAREVHHLIIQVRRDNHQIL